MQLLISILSFVLGLVCSYEEHHYNAGHLSIADAIGNSEAARRYARSPGPVPFVSRPNRGGSVWILPPGVNPTFPRDGGQWPEAYKHDAPRYARSLVPVPHIDDSFNKGGPVLRLPPEIIPAFPEDRAES